MDVFVLLALVASSAARVQGMEAGGSLKRLAVAQEVEAPVLTSALGWRDCEPEFLHSPKDTEQVADMLMALHREAKANKDHYLVRATHREFFNHNDLNCPSSSSTDAKVVIVDMSHMNQLLQVNTKDMTITVQAGMTLQELQDHLLHHNLSVPGVVAVPHIGGMTLGGALATGAQGSSLVGPASLGPYVKAAVVVDGTGDVLLMETPGDQLEGSLGLLGIVTELTLAVAPLKKVAVKQLQLEDHGMVGELREMIENSEAVSLDVTWNPSAGMYTARVWYETEASMQGEASNVFMHAPEDWLKKVNNRLHRDQLDTGDEHGLLCEVLGDLSTRPHFTASDGSEGSLRGLSIGPINKMASVSCPGADAKGCFWKRAKWTPYEVAISAEDFAAWVEDVKSVLGHLKGCPSFMFTFRFAMESDSLLAMHSGKQVVTIGLHTHSSLRADLPIKAQDLFEEVLQLTLCKYEGRPNWALSSNRMLLGPCPVRDKFGYAFDEFLERRRDKDPRDTFVAPLVKRMIERRDLEAYPGCAQYGDCFCQEDAHCAPQQRCQPGRVFKEYNVCHTPATAGSGGEL